MEIDTVTALLKQHVYEQRLEETETASAHEEPLPEAHGLVHVWEKSPSRPWTTREPYSPPTMGFPLPYLDVMTVQSKRLLPMTRKELDAQQRQLLLPRQHHNHPAVDGEDDSDPEDRDSAEKAREEEAGTKDGTPREKSDKPSDREPDVDAMLRSVRLLMEPLVIPDLAHTGVTWQFAQRNVHSDETAPIPFCVTVPNHSIDETQVKLFYPTGAKNPNMREYIKDTIQRHMAGFLADPNEPLDGSSPAKASQSMPTLSVSDEGAVELSGGSPIQKKTKAKHKAAKLSSYGSPTKGSSPQKRSNGLSSGARLSGSVSTSGLLNPEMTRQTKDILAQLRANTNKINDLIGS